MRTVIAANAIRPNVTRLVSNRPLAQTPGLLDLALLPWAMMRVARNCSARADLRATTDINALIQGADAPVRHSAEPRAMAFDADQVGARGPAGSSTWLRPR
jgi:hypothetical protein